MTAFPARRLIFRSRNSSKLIRCSERNLSLLRIRTGSSIRRTITNSLHSRMSLSNAECVELDGNGYMQFNIMNRSGKGYYVTGGHAIPITWEKEMPLTSLLLRRFRKEITLNTGKHMSDVATYRWEELIMN